MNPSLPPPRDLDAVFPLVYDELRRIAHSHLRREQSGHTLSTTDLVHEAYVRLADQTGIPVHERSRFFVIAATAMRRVLIEYARLRQAAKRGGGAEMVSLDEHEIAADQSSEMLIALDEALTRLAALDARLASVVECRYFGGLTEEETADALQITARTVRRDWTKAKEWLYAELR
jgi:RNA polymerase sigma factor (TIGR02999 family)